MNHYVNFLRVNAGILLVGLMLVLKGDTLFFGLGVWAGVHMHLFVKVR